MARDEGPLGHYPAKWERDAQKRARRAAGHQLTTEDRLVYEQERSTADHDYEQAQLRAARREDEQPLDLLNISTEGRIEFARLHDALTVDEAGVPRLRPDFLRYLDAVRGEFIADAGSDSGSPFMALLEGWRQLCLTTPLRARVLYHVHILGQSQSAAAEELGLDRMVLRAHDDAGRSFLDGFMRACVRPAAARVVLRGAAGAHGRAPGLILADGGPSEGLGAKHG